MPTAEQLFAFAAQFEGAYAPTVTIEIQISFDSLDGLTTAGLRDHQLPRLPAADAGPPADGAGDGPLCR